MANAQLSKTLAQFTARVQRSKNRLVAIPAEVQRQIGLERKRDNDLLLVSLRPRGHGRWSHHYLKLTADNEFSIPTDVARFQPGNEIDVRVHLTIPCAMRPAGQRKKETAAQVLLDLMKRPRKGWRTDGSTRLDEYLNADIKRINDLRGHRVRRSTAGSKRRPA